MFTSIFKFTASALLAAVLIGCAGLGKEKQQTLEQLKDDAQTTMVAVEKKLEESPESALQDSLKVLDTILEYTDEVKADPGKFSPEEIQAFMHKIRIINENIERFSDLTLQTDVSFPLGTYKLESLAEAGKAKSAELANKVLDSLRELAQKYSGHQVRVIIKSVGYTDETPIIEGSYLEQEIRANLAGEESESEPRRTLYNEVLSRFRAATLNEYVVQRIEAGLPDNLQVEVIPKIVGRGETFPKDGADPPYQRKDNRRRICILSPFIEIIP